MRANNKAKNAEGKTPESNKFKTQRKQKKKIQIMKIESKRGQKGKPNMTKLLLPSKGFQKLIYLISWL